MTRLVPPLTLLALLLALAGCGDSEKDPSAGRPATVDENDERAVALDCLTRVQGLSARPVGEEEISVGDPERGPMIRFFLTGGEAEARQFEGEFEGSEHIGAALLFVREGSEDELEDVEFCLEHP